MQAAGAADRILLSGRPGVVLCFGKSHMQLARVLPTHHHRAAPPPALSTVKTEGMAPPSDISVTSLTTFPLRISALSTVKTEGMAPFFTF
jgi:hypothetical protein